MPIGVHPDHGNPDLPIGVHPDLEHYKPGPSYMLERTNGVGKLVLETYNVYKGPGTEPIGTKAVVSVYYEKASRRFKVSNQLARTMLDLRDQGKLEPNGTSPKNPKKG